MSSFYAFVGHGFTHKYQIWYILNKQTLFQQSYQNWCIEYKTYLDLQIWTR